MLRKIQSNLCVKFYAKRKNKLNVTCQTALTLFSFYRFGWYLPTSFVEGLWNDSRIIADSWRALQLQSVVGQLLQNASLLNSYIKISEYKKSCEDIAGCSHGWLHGTKCRDGDNAMHCGVLLADFPGGFVS